MFRLCLFSVFVMLISCFGKSKSSEEIEVDKNIVDVSTPQKKKENGGYISYHDNGHLKSYLYFPNDTTDCWTQGIFFRKDGAIKTVIIDQDCYEETDADSEYFETMIYESDFIDVDSLGEVEKIYFRCDTNTAPVQRSSSSTTDK